MITCSTLTGFCFQIVCNPPVSIQSGPIWATLHLHAVVLHCSIWIPLHPPAVVLYGSYHIHMQLFYMDPPGPDPCRSILDLHSIQPLATSMQIHTGPIWAPPMDTIHVDPQYTQWLPKLFLVCQTKCPADIKCSVWHFDSLLDIRPAVFELSTGHFKIAPDMSGIFGDH